MKEKRNMVEDFIEIDKLITKICLKMLECQKEILTYQEIDIDYEEGDKDFEEIINRIHKEAKNEHDKGIRRGEKK